MHISPEYLRVLSSRHPSSIWALGNGGRLSQVSYFSREDVNWGKLKGMIVLPGEVFEDASSQLSHRSLCKSAWPTVVFRCPPCALLKLVTEGEKSNAKAAQRMRVLQAPARHKVPLCRRVLGRQRRRSITQVSAEHCPHSRAASRIISNDKILHWDPCVASNDPNQSHCFCVGSVILVAVFLYHHALNKTRKSPGQLELQHKIKAPAPHRGGCICHGCLDTVVGYLRSSCLVHGGFVLRLVFLGVVRMHRVRHVRADEERTGKDLVEFVFALDGLESAPHPRLPTQMFTTNRNT